MLRQSSNLVQRFLTRFYRGAFRKILQFQNLLFRFSTWKTCLNLRIFLPHLTLCEFWYTIQHTSTFQMALIRTWYIFSLGTRFYRGAFPKYLEFLNFLSYPILHCENFCTRFNILLPIRWH